MLESFTAETFAVLVGDEFRVHGDDGQVHELRLAAAVPVGLAPANGREPFSILFRGADTPILPQRTYAVEHATLGRFDLFLVPLGPDDAGARYEAVFS
jgi:hypothetical protein